MENKDNFSAEICPDAEALSAYMDGETDSSGSLAEHINNCAKCKEKLAEFKLIADAMHNKADAVWNETNALARIQLGLKNKLEAEGIAYSYQEKTAPESKQAEEQKPIQFNSFGWVMRYAAILVLGVVLFYMIQNEKTKNPGLFNGPKQPENTTAGTTENPPGGTTTFTSNTEFTNPAALGSRFVILDPPPCFHHDGTKSMFCYNQEPVAISSNVKQIWLLPGQDLADAEKKITQICRKIGVKDYKITKISLDSFALQVYTSADKAAQLNRACYGLGMKQLSSQMPAPEQRCYSGNGSEPVHYAANFYSPFYKK